MQGRDLELVLAWRSNPHIYRHFYHQEGPINWDDHITWYESRHPDRHDFIIKYESRRVGVVSITKEDKISIYLGDISARGHGVAMDAIKWICGRFEHRTPMVANIHEENGPSKRLFERCGFSERNRNEKWIEYVYDP